MSPKFPPTPFLRLSKFIILCLILFACVHPVFAHANLSRSEPQANTALAESPAEIRLWFTEPLEPDFSRITLRGISGAIVETPPSQIDSADPMQMFLTSGLLPDGLYTVVWRVVSAADGHMTAGSFPIAVGNATFDAAALIPKVDEAVASDGILVRWANLFSMALAVGSIGFWQFVWKPLNLSHISAAEIRLHRLIWTGWALAGLAGILALLLQVSIAAETTLLGAIKLDMLMDYVGGTRYGTLWLIRMGLWWLMGGALFIAGGKIRAQYIAPLRVLALVCGSGMLLTTSLFSHASAAQDELAAVAGDWLHLVATALWLGGLIVFALVIPPVRQQSEDASGAVGRLVAGFSNYARAAVAALIVTGVYAAWLQVGSVEALLTTVYGRALFVKLILILPLLAISGVNLVFTHRGLKNGQMIWIGRLRGLIGMEIALVIGVLLTVGVMTSGAPARGVIAVRDAEAPPIPEISSFQMQEDDTLMTHLEIIPGTVGENTFNVSLYDLDGNPITDASRIRLRFNSLDQNIGESELRPELQPDGTYTISGANLSVPGNWRVRMTVARPGEFDSVIDFEPQVNLPLPPPAPVIDAAIPAFNRVIAALLAGMGLVSMGGFLITLNGLRWSGGGDWLAGGLVVVGALFLITAAGSVNALERSAAVITVRDVWTYPGTITSEASVYMTLENQTDRDDRLISATSEAASDVTFHLTQVRDGVARMRPIDDLELPAGSSVSLAPGGYHLMLEHLERDFIVGDTFPLTLTFASGDEITVNVIVSEGAPADDSQN